MTTHHSLLYATEAAYACIRYGLGKLGFQTIIGRAVVENIASQKVLEKCGLMYTGEEMVDGYTHKNYGLSKEEFERR